MTNVGATNAGARICAVVVTYQRRAHLERTVARLLDEGVERIVIVDNGSTDGSRAWLAARAAQDPRLEVLESPENRGGAGGFEAGLAHAARGAGDWFVLMDDDGRPQPGAIGAFRDALAQGEGARWDAIATAVHYPDGRICEMNRPWVNPFWHGRAFARTLLSGGRRGAFHIADSDYTGGAATPIDGTSFVGLFLSRRAVEAAGLPDGRLFIYGDDVIYTLGFRRHALRIGFHPALRFEHDCSTFDAGGRMIYSPLWKVYYGHRNRLLMYRAAAGRFFWPVFALMTAKWRANARHYPAEDRALFRSLLDLAIRDALRGELNRPHAEIVERSRAKG